MLLVLGSGLSQRDTLFWDRKILPRRSLVHVDLDPKVIGRTWHAEVPLVGDCGEVLRNLMGALPERLAGLAATNPERRVWLKRLKSSGPCCYDEEHTNSDAVPLHPARVVRDLRRVMPRETVLVVDSGATGFLRPLLGGLRAAHLHLGYEPGAHGLGDPGGHRGQAGPAQRPLVVATGDGCMLMHGMEIQTAGRYGIPVIFLVINNSALGNVWLRARKEGPGPAALAELPTHDWAGFARALGLKAATVTDPADLAPAFQAALAAKAPISWTCAVTGAVPPR